MTEQPSPPPPNRRRSSIVEMFNPRFNQTPAASSSPPSAAVPSSPSAPQHRRGMSITALGMTGTSPGQPSPFNAFAKQRRASVATSSGTGSPEFRNSFGDEPAVIEEDDQMKGGPFNTPATPFARRVSFGAQALRDVRQGGSPTGSGGGRRPSTSLFTLDESNENNPPARRAPSGTAKTAGEGFNWSEALRDRTKRTPSFSSGNPFGANSTRPRATSMTATEPPKEILKPVEPPARMKKPDHLGERMLRGDFMMD